jgi:hypothetical protein
MTLLEQAVNKFNKATGYFCDPNAPVEQILQAANLARYHGHDALADLLMEGLRERVRAEQQDQ